MSYVTWKLSAMRIKHAELPLIVEAARYGDSVAYNELVSRCFQPVRRYCSTMGSAHDAYDLAQETFLRALKSKSLTTEVTNLEAFMIYIAKNVCADYIREISKTRRLNSHNDYTNADHAIPEGETDYIECEELLNPLSSDMREAFVLTQLLGFSYEEVSKISEVPIGTVRSRVSRARDTLQSSYQACYS